MNINIEHLENTVIVEISGQLNATTTAEIQDQILNEAQEGNRILLDMSNVTYLSSAGLRLLLLLYRRIDESHGSMVLTGLTEEVRDIMALTGFLDLFNAKENRSAGLLELKKAG